MGRRWRAVNGWTFAPASPCLPDRQRTHWYLTRVAWHLSSLAGAVRWCTHNLKYPPTKIEENAFVDGLVQEVILQHICMMRAPCAPSKMACRVATI